jgi:hypothetical protein
MTTSAGKIIVNWRSHHTNTSAAFAYTGGVENVMAANSLISVELLKSCHINAAESRMNSGVLTRSRAWEAFVLPLNYTRKTLILN